MYIYILICTWIFFPCAKSWNGMSNMAMHAARGNALCPSQPFWQIFVSGAPAEAHRCAPHLLGCVFFGSSLHVFGACKLRGFEGRMVLQAERF